MVNIVRLFSLQLLLIIAYEAEAKPFYYGSRSTRRNRNNSRRRGVLHQMAAPLTTNICERKPYSELRSCKLYRAKKSKKLRKFLSKKYFCAMKDAWFEKRQNKRFRDDDDDDDDDRKKRAVNQCGGTETRRVILQAYEAKRPEVLRELLHDPENHLYQTIFVRECQSRSPIRGFKCTMHPIKFKAAVFSLNPKSTRISVIDVMIDGYCALTQA